MMRLCLFRMAGLVFLLMQTRTLGDLALSILTLEYLAIPSLPFALLVVGMQVLFFLTQLAASMVLIVWIINKIGFQGEKPESARPRFTPSYAAPVDIIIFTCREPLAVIERTLMATTQIDWPPHLLNIYLSDDGNDPAVRQLVEQAARDHKEICRVAYLNRQSRFAAKSGNILFAIEASAQHCGGSQLVLTLDADMAPDASILKELVPYFSLPSSSTDHKPLGFVQAPQFFVNAPEVDWLARSQLFFNLLLQRFYDQWATTLWSGTNALFNRAALSPPILKWLVENPSLTEDAFATFLIHSMGFSSIYHESVVARGLAVPSLLALASQNLRIMTGVIQNLLHSRCLTRLPKPISFKYWRHSFSLVLYPLYRLAPTLVVLWQLIRLLHPPSLAPAVQFVLASGGPFKSFYPWVALIAWHLHVILHSWEFRAELWRRARFDNITLWSGWLALVRGVLSVCFRVSLPWSFSHHSLFFSLEYWSATAGLFVPMGGSLLSLFLRDPVGLMVFVPPLINISPVLPEWWRLTFNGRTEPNNPLHEIIAARNDPSRKKLQLQEHTRWYYGFEGLFLTCTSMMLFSAFAASP